MVERPVGAAQLLEGKRPMEWETTRRAEAQVTRMVTTSGRGSL